VDALDLIGTNDGVFQGSTVLEDEDSIIITTLFERYSSRFRISSSSIE
jgi:hypothetical protein